MIDGTCCHHWRVLEMGAVYTARPRREVGTKMLRIEKDCDENVSRLRLSGRIESDLITCIRSAMNDCCEHRILDLSEVTLVDVGVVRFLIRSEDEGIELVQCPPYVRKWMLRERAEGGQAGSSNAT
jgi:hypothetical protein